MAKLSTSDNLDLIKEVCEVLGFDYYNVKGMTIQVRRGELPSVIVEKYMDIPGSKKLITYLDDYELKRRVSVKQSVNSE